MGSGKSINTAMKLLNKEVRDELKSIKKDALHFLPMAMLVMLYTVFALVMIMSFIMEFSGGFGSC